MGLTVFASALQHLGTVLDAPAEDEGDLMGVCRPPGGGAAMKSLT